MKKRLNITVVGGGPIGCHLAYMLKKQGHFVTIFEQKKEIGVPLQCTGIVTHDILSLIEVPDNLILNKIKKVNVNINEKVLSIKNDDIVIDRVGFDKHLEKKALDLGVKIFYNHRLTDIYKKHGRLKVIIKNTITDELKNPEFDILIGADGPDSKISKFLNPRNKVKHYYGIQQRVEGKFEKSTYNTFFGDDFPNFFGWIVPESNTVARIGLASLKNPKSLFNNFVKGIEIKKVLESGGGLIPIYNPTLKIFGKIKKQKIFTIGDAATQVKATTGGGLVQGIIAAKQLNKAIMYKIPYKIGLTTLRKDLRVSLSIRKVLNKMKNKDYEELIEILNNKKSQKTLEDISRDNPLKLLTSLITKNPSLLKLSKLLF